MQSLRQAESQCRTTTTGRGSPHQNHRRSNTGSLTRPGHPAHSILRSCGNGSHHPSPAFPGHEKHPPPRGRTKTHRPHRTWMRSPRRGRHSPDAYHYAGLIPKHTSPIPTTLQTPSQPCFTDTNRHLLLNALYASSQNCVTQTDVRRALSLGDLPGLLMFVRELGSLTAKKSAHAETRRLLCSRDSNPFL